MSGLRERRRDFASADIARHAIELFAERGFDDVTVDEISAAAGISPRTFFRYFPAKSDVLREHQRRLFSRLAKFLVDRPSSEAPLVALRNAFLATAEMRDEDRDRLVAIGKLLVRDDLSSAHAFGFETGRIDEIIGVLADRGAAVDIDLEAIVGALLGAAQASYRHWVRHDGQTPLRELMQQAFTHVRISPPPARPSPSRRRPPGRSGS